LNLRILRIFSRFAQSFSITSTVCIGIKISKAIYPELTVTRRVWRSQNAL
jgi:hypothetical protein